MWNSLHRAQSATIKFGDAPHKTGFRNARMRPSVSLIDLYSSGIVAHQTQWLLTRAYEQKANILIDFLDDQTETTVYLTYQETSKHLRIHATSLPLDCIDALILVNMFLMKKLQLVMSTASPGAKQWFFETQPYNSNWAQHIHILHTNLGCCTCT